MPLITEYQKLNQKPFIDLFELDLNPIGFNLVYYFVPDKESDGSNIRYKGKDYVALPLEVKGFEATNKAPFPRPTMIISNILGTVSSYMALYQDLVGARVTRLRTLVAYLENHPESGAAEDTQEIYYVEQPESENDLTVSYILVNGLEMENINIPGRYITRRCGWRYRDASCGYTGTAYFDLNNNPTSDPTQDICAQNLDACKLRFGASTPLNYGGFVNIDYR